jgi:hypothetical protein
VPVGRGRGWGWGWGGGSSLLRGQCVDLSLHLGELSLRLEGSLLCGLLLCGGLLLAGLAVGRRADHCRCRAGDDSGPRHRADESWASSTTSHDVPFTLLNRVESSCWMR